MSLMIFYKREIEVILGKSSVIYTRIHKLEYIIYIIYINLKVEDIIRDVK